MVDNVFIMEIFFVTGNEFKVELARKKMKLKKNNSF